MGVQVELRQPDNTITPQGGVGDSAKTYEVTLPPGGNQPVDLQEASPPGSYVSGSGVTTGADINLGNPGAAGNKLYAISVFNGSASAFTACTLWDGATQLDFLTLGMTTLGAGNYATWVPAGGVLESKNGGFKLRITCAGTMSAIKWGAVVAE